MIPTVALTDYLATVAMLVRKYDYLQRTGPMGTATYQYAWDLWQQSNGNELDDIAECDDLAAEDARVHWCKPIPDAPQLTSYERAMRSAMRQDIVTATSAQLVAAAFYYYQDIAPLLPTNGWYGEVGGDVGDTVPLPVRVLKLRPAKGLHNIVVMRLQDDDLHVFTWRGARAHVKNIAVGARIGIVGTIRAHWLWNGLKETALSHAVFYPCNDNDRSDS